MIQAPIGFHCPEDAKQGRQKVYTSQTLFRGSPGQAVLTMAIIALNVAVFVVGIGLGEDANGISGADRLRLDGGLIARAFFAGEEIGVGAGEWYRLVTSGFLHASLIHVGFNMYLLYMLGQQLERSVGRARFGVTYFFAMLCGSLGALILSPDDLTVGASGAVFGLMGLAVVVQRAQGINPFDTGLGTLIVLNLVITFAFGGQISIGGHVGGLIGGFVAGAVLVELPKRSRALPGFLPIAALVALGAAVVAASIAVASSA
jgi:membrane associated rhomboid family serine protease